MCSLSQVGLWVCLQGTVLTVNPCGKTQTPFPGQVILDYRKEENLLSTAGKQAAALFARLCS